jgi:hypothetical protein
MFIFFVSPKEGRTLKIYLVGKFIWEQGGRGGTVLCSFLFAHPKRNEPKKKDAGNDNCSLFWQNAPGITLPEKAAVRAISGVPAHRLKK